MKGQTRECVCVCTCVYLHVGITSPDLAGVRLFAHLDLPFPSSWKIEWGRSGEGYKGKEISLGNSTYGTNLCA